MLQHTRQHFAKITRAAPAVRGLGRCYRLANGAFLKAGASPIDIAVMKDGTRVVVDLRTQTEIVPYYRGEYDDQSLRMCKRLFDPNGVFMDVGANVGFYAVAISQWIRQQSGQGRLVCFEPHPANHARLNENLKANSLDSLATCINAGLSSHRGTLDLVMREDFAAGGMTGNASIAIGDEMDAGFNTIAVAVRTLDDMIPELSLADQSIDFIKVDIEGHEDLFLAGASQTLARHRPVLMLEVNVPYYEARGVSANASLMNNLPENTRLFRQAASNAMIEIRDLQSCTELDNIFVIPAERFDAIRNRAPDSKWLLL